MADCSFDRIQKIGASIADRRIEESRLLNLTALTLEEWNNRNVNTE